MKAMILSAGIGKRMQPLTLEKPKPLLSIKGHAMIEYHLMALAKAKITEIVINLGYLGDQIEDFLGNGSRYGVAIAYTHEDPILETGGGIVNALPLLGRDPFLVISCDIWTNFLFKHLPSAPKGLAHLVMVDNPPFHPEGDYGLQGEWLSKTATPRFNYAGIGIYRPELFEGCEGIFPLFHVVEQAIMAKQVTGERFKGRWHNVGTPEQLRTLNRS